jgi:CheY-like chemotaxis protein/signal transduction histidine kinase/CHASE3 domain sensor protein
MFKMSFQRQVLLGFVVSIFLVLLINALAFFSTRDVSQKSGMVNHTQEVINKANDVYLLLVNAETGQRGYVITGEERYLEPYKKGVSNLETEMNNLAMLILDNPRQVVTVDSLRNSARQKTDEMERILSIRNEKGFRDARGAILQDKGKKLMSDIRHYVQSLIMEEQRLLAMREVETKKVLVQTYIIIVLGFITVLAILLYMLFNITRTFRMQREAEERLKQSNAELATVSNENVRRNWLLTGSTGLSERTQGEYSLSELSKNIITSLAEYLDARIGAIYFYNRSANELMLTGTYAYDREAVKIPNIKLGEGLVGQAAMDRKTVVYNEVPEDYIKVKSGLGSARPVNIVVAPVFSGNKLSAVVELGFSEQVAPNYLDYLQLVNENIAIALQSAKAREIMQQQAEELQTQQEELQQTNEELTSQTSLLQASEEELRVQQEELQQTNAELEEKATLLEEKNKVVEEAREAVMQKAQELEQTNRYKSEFLANMSHELRTPLNSILILAKLLSENKNNTLAETEIKYASVIYNSGNDLLTLINDILDLSKIESGKLDMTFEAVPVSILAADMESMFRHVAENKNIRFTIDSADAGLPKEINTDRQRLEQILRNLLSNAFKFTPQKGSIDVVFRNYDGRLKIDVKDTGVGIPADKQRIIFEAFQQADGTTSRKYGGTGLGLSISRELISLLGGEITLQSTPGEGSVFSVIIPFEFAVSIDRELNSREQPAEPVTLQPVKHEPGSSNTILIVEDDLNFAAILKEYAEGKGFQTLIAHDGEAGYNMASEYRPKAILLDIMLPGMDGWQVLKKLKGNPELMHIPVHIMSANVQNSKDVANSGALGFVEKPVSTNTLENLFTSIDTLFNMTQNGENENSRQILLIEDNETESEQLKQVLTKESIRVLQAYTGKQALEMLDHNSFDCVVLDLRLPDMDGTEVLSRIKAKEELQSLPVIINTAMDIPSHIQAEIIKHSNAFVLKNKRSNERIMDEIMLFMNKISQAGGQKAAQGKPVISRISAATVEKTLKGKRVLLVDDDMRNIFALSSILQQYDLNVEIAGNGTEALEKLKADHDFDIILMDIMMPEMDGYEATRQVRKMPVYKHIPIIALTAKAMKNDREKCMEAGASDYMAKPVDPDKLMSLMRVWLSR